MTDWIHTILSSLFCLKSSCEYFLVKLYDKKKQENPQWNEVTKKRNRQSLSETFSMVLLKIMSRKMSKNKYLLKIMSIWKAQKNIKKSKSFYLNWHFYFNWKINTKILARIFDFNFERKFWRILEVVDIFHV
jgi:hypothetical protein